MEEHKSRQEWNRTMYEVGATLTQFGGEFDVMAMHPMGEEE